MLCGGATFHVSDTSPLFRSAGLTAAQTIVSGAVLFLLYRYLLGTLGASAIGVWSLVLAATSASRISDFGLTGSVVRFVAKHRARDDAEAVRGVIETAALSVALLFGALSPVLYGTLRWVVEHLVPAAAQPSAVHLVPLALGSLWLSAVAGVFQAGLDGCQRFDVRNAIVAGGNVLYLFLAVVLVPRFGLLGLGYVQVFQSLVLLIVIWIVLRRELECLPVLPRRWSRTRFAEMRAYGANFQLVTLLNLLFDFTTKALLGRLGSMSEVGYFDMASRMVLQIRALIVSANQLTVPVISGAQELAPERVRWVYERSVGWLSYCIAPLFGAVMAGAPLICLLWIGRPERTFTAFVLILAAGWAVNSFNGPSYFSNLGTGELRWNTRGHLVIAVLNPVLGYLLGRSFGAIGVVTGWVVALDLGSCLIVWHYHRSRRIPFRCLAPLDGGALIGSAIAGIATAGVVADLFAGRGGAGVALCIYALVIAPAVWRFPLRTDLAERLARKVALRPLTGTVQ